MKWISVEDRLPEKTQRVEFKGQAVFHISETASLPNMGFIGTGAWERDSGIQNAITHWRPIKLPKENK